jgi:hypothetical protein
MLRIEHDKWGQSVEDLRGVAMGAGHARTRERFMALFEIARGTENATTWAASAGKHFQTVMSWVHAYNERGPDALVYRHTGGWPAPFSPSASGDARAASRRSGRRRGNAAAA